MLQDKLGRGLPLEKYLCFERCEKYTPGFKIVKVFNNKTSGCAPSMYSNGYEMGI